MESFSIQPNRVESNLSLEEVFSEPLYTNSNISRIVLHRPICQAIRCGDWYRIDLKLVTEMGLPVRSHSEAINLSGTVLTNSFGYYEPLTHVESRPISTEDDWEPEMSLSNGFNAHSSFGALEYRITSSIDQPFFVTFQSSNQNILSLCVGPIWMEDQPKMKEWISESLDESQQQQYRAIEINPSRYFLIKEQWEDGTPGKVWDSALVIVELLMKNVDLMTGKRILDLSAGTGYIGLSIAQLFQSLPKTFSRPSVILSDIPEALDLIRANQELNDIRKENLVIEPLFWGDKQDAKKLLKGDSLDIIIASDIIYRRNDFVNIVAALQQLCTPNTVVYMGYKTRGLKFYEEKEFFDICQKSFHVQLLNYDPRTGVRLYKMKKIALYLKKNQ